jgi:pyridoxal 5'-phosphate synthase pdxS subunit
MRSVLSEIRALRGQDEKFLSKKAVEYRVPVELVSWVAESQCLPVPNFSAGGIATPADAALMMQLGAESVFVGSGIFKSEEPSTMAKAIVQAATNFENPKVLAEISYGLGAAMRGLEVTNMPEEERMASRGW